MTAAKFVYEGVEFGSQEALDLYRASRATGGGRVEAVRPAGQSLLVWLTIGALVIGILIYWLTPNKRAEPGRQLDAAVAIGKSGFPRKFEGGLAYLINANSELCGTVLNVTPKEDGLYLVECTRYRSGQGRAEYTVDLKTGEVR